MAHTDEPGESLDGTIRLVTSSRVFEIGKRPDETREGFAAWLKEEQIPVIFEQRVPRVEKSGATITKLILELAPPDK